MPQELIVLQCHVCKMFQVHLIKKANKWQCKVCSEKHRFKKIYFQGSGKDCRIQVQKLNALNSNENSENLENINPGNSENYVCEDNRSRFLNVKTSVNSKPSEYLKVSEKEDYFNHETEILQKKKDRLCIESSYIHIGTLDEELSQINVFSHTNDFTEVSEKPNYKIEQENNIRKHNVDDMNEKDDSTISPSCLGTKKRKLDVTTQGNFIKTICNSSMNICCDGNEMKNNSSPENSNDFEVTSTGTKFYEDKSQCTLISSTNFESCNQSLSQGLAEIKSGAFDKNNLLNEHQVNTDKLYFSKFDFDCNIEQELNNSVLNNKLECKPLKNEDTDNFIDKSLLRRDSIFESSSIDSFDFNF